MLLSWLCRSARRPKQRPGGGRPPRLAVEPLEGRDLPSLSAPVVYETGQQTQGLAVGDLRGNGRLDLVTADYAGVSVFLGNGDGTFGAPTPSRRAPVPPGSSWGTSTATAGSTSP
jgi:hypothetical protein